MEHLDSIRKPLPLSRSDHARKGSCQGQGGQPLGASRTPQTGHRSAPVPATAPPGTRLPVLRVGESPRGSPSPSSAYWADPRLPRQARGTNSPKFLDSRWNPMWGKAWRQRVPETVTGFQVHMHFSPCPSSYNFSRPFVCFSGGKQRPGCEGLPCIPQPLRVPTLLWGCLEESCALRAVGSPQSPDQSTDSWAFSSCLG